MGDNLDNAVDEDDINALIETNPNVKKVLFLLLIPHNGWQKSFSGSKNSLLSPIAASPGSQLVALPGCCLLSEQLLCADCTVPGEAKEKFLPASRENELFTNKSTKNNENTRNQT